MIVYERPFSRKATVIANLEAFSTALRDLLRQVQADGHATRSFFFRTEGNLIFVGVKAEKIPGGMVAPGEPTTKE